MKNYVHALSGGGGGRQWAVKEGAEKEREVSAEAVPKRQAKR